MTAPPPMTLPGATPYDPALSATLRTALAGQGEDYRPRTHHLIEDGAPRYINRLILETSPYLLQHAHNPVDWFPWGEEAFEVAKRRGVPVFLSVGYSTCHWCHVMERESFEDEEIAAYLNQNYVAIKVDREERPDVDSVYMTAVQVMTGRGGWPMTVIMAPDKRPFFGGTYFPARDGDRGIQFGFLTILRRLAEAYRQDRDELMKSANRLTAALQTASTHSPGDDVPGPEAIVSAATFLAQRFDPVHGGFGRAPKFPRPSTYELLLRYARRTGDPGALHVVTHSLRRMMNGGIYDHVGGGFARYSTDQQWLVPHFEKMLYDNAQLVSLLIETYQASGDADFARVAKETLDYVRREMTSPEGGFYSATDADSEWEEGKFFVWSVSELLDLLGPDRTQIVRTYYGVTESGNFEGHNILHAIRTRAQAAEIVGLSRQDFDRELEAIRSVLYEARKKRVHPLLDDKVLTEWNGQMIGAFARAGFALDEPKYLETATRAARFVLQKLYDGKRLLRAYRKGQAKHRGVLEDYAFVIAGLLDLYEATGHREWLEHAVELQKGQDARFASEDGAYFGTPDDGEALLVREKPLYDGAQPSGNSVSAQNLLRLGELTTDTAYVARADGIFRAFAEPLRRGAAECPKLAAALDYRLDRVKEIVIAEDAPGAGKALVDVVRQRFEPSRVLVVATTTDLVELASVIPFAEGKRPLNDAPATGYVCYQQTCKKPTSDPTELRAQLDEVEKIQAIPLALPQ